MADNKRTWIQTRDGSPTLWSNELAESFRSVKGAFTESFKVFIEPALEDLKKTPRESVVIGEFGLGPGTNWIMAELFIRPLVKKLSYFAVEKESLIFEEGFEKWKNSFAAFESFAKAFSLPLSREHFDSVLGRLPNLITFPNLKLAVQSGIRVDFWFHDPFGFDVNPEGYSEESLKECRHFFKVNSVGMSYACNKFFQGVLDKTLFHSKVLPSGDPLLKRERIEFRI